MLTPQLSPTQTFLQSIGGATKKKKKKKKRRVFSIAPLSYWCLSTLLLANGTLNLKIRHNFDPLANGGLLMEGNPPLFKTKNKTKLEVIIIIIYIFFVKQGM